MSNPAIRVRFAPSPTGPMTLGNARTALFNWLFARSTGGTFVVRIEDTDKERSRTEHEKDLLESLQWIGINWDEGPAAQGVGEQGEYGPYHQTERLAIYREYLEKLLQKGEAYYCYCTKEELEVQRQNALAAGEPLVYSGKCRHRDEVPQNAKSVIRFHIPQQTITFRDIIRGEVVFDTATIGDIVIAKNLDEPLYNFAVVVDDQCMRISHVIRGEDHIANTPKQIALQKALGFTGVQYAHLPLMLAADRSKLSKRTADISILSYRERGYLPHAVMNFLALLGWHPTGEQEIFEPHELIAIFDIERVQKAGAIFNPEKLTWINAQHIKKMTNAQLAQVVAGSIPPTHALSSQRIEKIIAITRDRLNTLQDFTDASKFFFEIADYDTSLLVWKKDTAPITKQIIEKILGVLEAVDEQSWSGEVLQQSLQSLCTQYSNGSVLWPLRVALSGLAGSPGPFEIADILGKDEVIRRIKHAYEKLSSLE